MAVSGCVAVREGVVLVGVPVRGLAATVDVSGSLGGSGGTSVEAAVSGISATVGGRALDQGATTLRYREGAFLLQDLRARFAAGQLTASVEAPFGKQKYKARVVLSNAGARELFAPGDPTSRLEGRVSGTMELHNPTGLAADLRGDGLVVEVRDGRLFEVPVIQVLYPVLRGMLLVQSDPEFTSALVKAHIRGDEIILDELVLRSSVVDLEKAKGGSRIYMDGRLDVGITPVFKVRDIPIIGVPLGAIVSVTLGNLLQRLNQFRVTGTVQNPVTSWSLLPGIMSRDDRGYHVEPPPPVVEPTPRAPVEW